MNRVVLSIIICTFPCFMWGKSDLTKQEKAIVKALKKQYKLEDVDVRHPYNSFTYYDLLTKDFNRMIADSTGNVIIPQSKLASDAYQNSIKFIMGHTQGYNNYRERGRNARSIRAYYPGNEPVFVANKSIGGGMNEYEFFSTSGEVLKTFDGNISESLSAPVNISKDMAGNFGVMTMDGRELLPCKYSSVEVREDGICSIMQIRDEIERMGGACISDMTKESVPCNFYYVEYSQSRKSWLVQIHEFDSLIVYDENKQYNTSFLDDGQRLFEMQQYEEARKYYSLNGDNAQWAKFYIGATYHISAQKIYDDMNDALMRLDRSSNRQDRHIAADIRSDIGLFKSETEKAERAFREYIDGNHTQYVSKAKEFLYELSKMQTNVLVMESRLGMALSDFERRCTDLEKREQEDYNRRLEQQQLNLERQKLHEQRLAREQRERDLRMRQRMEAERRQREARKREEEKRKAQLTQQRQGQQSQQPKRQQHNQNNQRQQTHQQQILEQRNKELRKEAAIPELPRKKVEAKSNKVE